MVPEQPPARRSREGFPSELGRSAQRPVEKPRPTLLIVFAFLVDLFAPGGWGLCAPALAAGAGEPPEAVAYCLGCHGEQDFSMTLDDGSEMSLYVDATAFAGSVHGPQLVCTDCHERYDENHPTGATFPGQREYVTSSYTLCKKCHFDTYTRTLESVHYSLLAEGLDAAPVCTDCHGAHDVADPHAKRAMISRSCAQCHTDIYDRYAKSVHGKALVEEDNQDVPACADCHTAHSIVDPTTAKFRLASPETCVGCHGNRELMARYEIPVTVAETYLADFHGVTASLEQGESLDERRLVVTCIDCHGVHDIRSPAALGTAAMKERVAEVCAGCHQDAPKDFPQAWLSHYQPSLKHAPLVYLVDLFYKIFIPFVVLGLVLQVLLHLYRVAIRR